MSRTGIRGAPSRACASWATRSCRQWSSRPPIPRGRRHRLADAAQCRRQLHRHLSAADEPARTSSPPRRRLCRRHGLSRRHHRWTPPGRRPMRAGAIVQDGAKVQRRFRLRRPGRRSAPAGFRAAPLPRLGQLLLRHQFAFLGQERRRGASAWCIVGERIDPARSNASLVVDDFLGNNAAGSMPTSCRSSLQTLVMAFVGTLFGALIAFPLAFLAARNITRSRIANWAMKRLLRLPALHRHADLGAVLHPRASARGRCPASRRSSSPTPARWARSMRRRWKTSTTSSAKASSRSGASPVACNRYGVVPQVLPVFISPVAVFLEINTRSATIIGAVGAGGIGLKLLGSDGHQRRLGQGRLYGAAHPDSWSSSSTASRMRCARGVIGKRAVTERRPPGRPAIRAG